MDRPGSLACLVCDGIPGCSLTWIAPIPTRSGFCGALPNDDPHSGFALDERTSDTDLLDRHSYILVCRRDFGRCPLCDTSRLGLGRGWVRLTWC